MARERAPAVARGDDRAFQALSQYVPLFLDHHRGVILRSGRGLRVRRRSLCASSSDSRRTSA